MSHTVRVLLILVATLSGALVGIIAGILTVVDGGSLPSALFHGAAGCAGATVFAFAVIKFWLGLRQ
ncbi:hypothetical protein ACFWF7_22420 [Nocardia sp. NPDC060256]|uniref:hypothetical protein n=1 Tax=unclassified Nocardia TaxID=2637762 RepID=UPI003667E47E